MSTQAEMRARRRADLEAAIEAGGSLSAKEVARYKDPVIKSFVMLMVRSSTKGMARTPWYSGQYLEFQDGSFVTINREDADTFLALPEAEQHRRIRAFELARRDRTGKPVALPRGR